MKVYHNSFYAKGSRLNLVFPYDDDEICERLFNSIKIEVYRTVLKLSYFNQSSDISIINNRKNDSLKVDLELFEIFKQPFINMKLLPEHSISKRARFLKILKL